MAGAVVHDPVDGPGRAVGLDCHDLVNEPAERDDPGRLLDPIKQVGVVHVPRSEVGQRPAAFVLELEQPRAPGAGRDGLMLTSERLQLGLLIRADHVLVRAQPPALKGAGVEVQHPAGFGGEVGVAREDPRARLPRLDRVLVQPAPDRRRRRLGDAALDHQAMQLSPGEARERQLVGTRQLARDRLDLGDLLRGENDAAGQTALDPQARQDARHRTGLFAARRCRASNPAERRYRCPASPRPHTGSSAPAAPSGTAT